MIRTQDFAASESWMDFWTLWVSVAFLKAYLATAGQVPFLPRTREELEGLLDAFLLEKAVYELGYELNNRPDWVRIPLQSLLQLVGRGNWIAHQGTWAQRVWRSSFQ